MIPRRQFCLSVERITTLNLNLFENLSIVELNFYIPVKAAEEYKKLS